MTPMLPTMEVLQATSWSPAHMSQYLPTPCSQLGLDVMVLISGRCRVSKKLQFATGILAALYTQADQLLASTLHPKSVHGSIAS